MIKDVKKGFFRKLGYLLAGLLFALICSKLGLITKVSAETLSLNKKTFRIRTCDIDSTDNCSWSSGESSWGSSISSVSDSKGVNGIMVRAGRNDKFIHGRVYRISVNFQYGLCATSGCIGSNVYYNLDGVICGGSSTSSWSSNESLIDSCRVVGKVLYDNNRKVSYYIDVVTNTDVYGIQFQLYFDKTTSFAYGSANVLNSTHIDFDNSTQDAINSQTQIIDSQTTKIIEQQNSTNEKLDEVKEAMLDDSSPNTDSLNNISGLLPPGPVDSILNLPLNVLNATLNIFDNSCNPLVIPLPFINSNLTIPCFWHIVNQIPGLNGALSTIFVLISAFILYRYFLYLYSWVDDVTSMKNNSPRLFGANSNADNWGGVE